MLVNCKIIKKKKNINKENNKPKLNIKNAIDCFEEIRFSNKNKINKKNSKYYSLFIFILIFLFNISSKEIKLRKIILDNEIKITIKGQGDQPILSDKWVQRNGINYTFNELPTEIIINDVPMTDIKRIYQLSNKINNITLKYNYSMTNCNLMFYGLSNIIKIDFSNFDSSKVTNMQRMFSDCTLLQSIDLTNFTQH